ncbi:T9SS type B sorting domain-containing protein [Kordia jejudonensis]|uniref:T9SS type B sorting domain-containing protein n=1 Tax=Kordia jejudonensis TaxID=1348245 RepID=UPI000629C81E|nr:T9SS type B sorting domain-containing protein [Kordia jejudonensis]
MHNTKVLLLCILGILSLSVSSNSSGNPTGIATETMMNPIEYIICDDDGFLELNIVAIQNDILSNYDGTTVEEAVLISTSSGHVLRLNDVSGTITTDVICQMPNPLTDIAVDENEEIFITDFTSITKLDEVSCTTTTLPNIPSTSLVNSLSFDIEGNLYYGAGDESVVYRYDSDQLSAPYEWHDFVSGTPSGDFVILNGKMYISWDVSGSIRLYEVTIDNNFNYVSHIDLGEILPNTFGLASELGNLYGVSTSVLYKIDLNTFTFTTVATNNLQYGQWYGAAGLNEAVAYSISSHLSNNDATNDVNPLPNVWTNTQQGGQTIFIRIENTIDGSFEIVEVNIVIQNTPNLSTPSNLTTCESNSNPTIFTLSDVETELLQNVPQPVTVSYHASQTDADESINPLNTTYPATVAQETIFIRVQNNDNDCFAITQFDVIREAIINITNPSDLFICDNQATNTILLTTIEAQLLQNSVNPATVSYHASQADADTNMNPLNTNYQVSTAQQTIYVRVENNNTNCVVLTQFDINLGESLQINTPDDLVQCQNDTNVFDLTQVEAQILASTAQAVTVTYYLSLDDANQSINPISTIYSPSSNLETVYVRVDATANDCFAITDFEIIINESLTITTPNNLVRCENENNTIFDLTQVENELLQNVTQTTTISYHTSLADATTNTNAINSQYNLVGEEATIYVRVENALNNCFEITQFLVQILTSPLVTPFANSSETRLLTECYVDNNGDGYFDLNDIYSEIITNGNTSHSLEFYLSVANAEQDINSIDPIYYAMNTTEEIFVTVTNTNGCKSITNFFVNPDCYNTVVDISNIYFPQFFTPNNDLTNDTWNVEGISIAVQQTAIMYIFDRYGKLLYYYRPGQVLGWDGTYRGRQMPSSEYWYRMELMDGATFKGSFSLVR